MLLHRTASAAWSLRFYASKRAMWRLGSIRVGLPGSLPHSAGFGIGWQTQVGEVPPPCDFQISGQGAVLYQLGQHLILGSEI